MGVANQTITVKFKRGIRTDGEIEYVSILQEGYGELRLTKEQAVTLAQAIQQKLGMIGVKG